MIFIWYPGSRGEKLVADLRVSSARVMLEVVYNSGTGWLYDSSGLQLYLSPRVPSETDLTTRLLINTQPVEFQCEASLVSASLHSNRAVDNMRLTSDSGMVISGYQSHHQPARHLLSPHNITRGTTLSLDCLQPSQCFALLTFKHQANCPNILTDKPADKLIEKLTGQNNLETPTTERKSSDETTTKMEMTDARQTSTIVTVGSSSVRNTAAPVTVKITGSTTSDISVDVLKTKDSMTENVNFTKMETKSDLSYKNDIANLDIQPRLLDDAGEPEYTKATEGPPEGENNGEINFQNVYRNSSNLPLSHFLPFVLLVFSTLNIWIKM